MKIENKTPTLLEQYKEQLELAKAIANLSPNEKECLFNQDLQDIFDNIKGYEKGTQGHNYKYANLTEVHRAIKEVCKNKVFFYHIDTATYLKTIVCHSLTGLKIEVESEKPSIEKMSSLNSRVNFMQAFGSWQTYTKRYHLLALFSVAEEDDGAEKLTENKENKVEKKFLPAKAPVEPVKLVESLDMDFLKLQEEARLVAKGGEAIFKTWFAELSILKQNLFSNDFKKELVKIYKNVDTNSAGEEVAIEKASKLFTPAKAPVEQVKKTDDETQKDMDYITGLIDQGVVTNINQVKNVILNNSIIKNKQLAEPKHLEKFKQFF